MPRSDHVHKGLHSISESGQPQLFGDVTFSEGAGVTLTQVGQDIAFATNPAGIDHGGLTGLGDDDHTQYLLVNGSRAMTGNFDLAGNSFLTTNFSLREGIVAGGVNGYNVWNRAGTDLRDLRCRDFYFGKSTSRIVVSDGGKLAEPSTVSATQVYSMTSGDGSVFKTIFRALGGAGYIDRAGDITMLAEKMMKLGVYSDATRPAAGTAGRMIFNTTDGNLNIDNGTDWILPNGTVT